MAKYLDSDGVAYLWSKIKALFAPLASPTFTGVPVAPTATTGDNSTQIATTAFVQNTVSSVSSGVTGVKGDAESTYRTGNVNITAANVGAATSNHTHGNITNGGDITAAAPTVASGDCLVINDDSASKITNGPAFGSSTTTYLRNDGTWGTPSDSDTKNTAGSTNDTAKLFLIGAKSQGANPQTYSHSSVYETNGTLYCSKICTDGSHSYEVGAAAEKAIGSVASGNAGLVTGGDVYTAIANAVAGSVQYQGTATSNSDLGTTYKKGYYWIVGTGGGTIAGQTCEAGDMVIAHADYSGTVASDVDIVQSNINRVTNADIDAIIAAA